MGLIRAVAIRPPVLVVAAIPKLVVDNGNNTAVKSKKKSYRA